jgi:hypothetical protein
MVRMDLTFLSFKASKESKKISLIFIYIINPSLVLMFSLFAFVGLDVADT